VYKRKEIHIDKEGQRYKRYFRLLGIPINEGWKTLPKVVQVGVTRISVSQTTSSPMPTIGNTSITSKGYKSFVFMIASRSKKIEIYRSEDHSKALEFAKPIAEYLNVPLVDHSSKS